MTTSQHFIRNSWKLLMKTNDFPRVGDFTPECTSPLSTEAVWSEAVWSEGFSGVVRSRKHTAPPAEGALSRSLFIINAIKMIGWVMPKVKYLNIFDIILNMDVFLIL